LLRRRIVYSVQIVNIDVLRLVHFFLVFVFVIVIVNCVFIVFFDNCFSLVIGRILFDIDTRI